ncbi:hypothetical protein F4604DRAFT_1676803 [Suillus subluteus]|nr:hypothetical protein F4604DRAFT_1676803 [Suillus subluteus]
MSDSELTCDYCGRTFKLRGFKMHRATCAKNARHLQEDLLHVVNTHNQSSATVDVEVDTSCTNQVNDQPEVHNAQVFDEPDFMDIDEWMDINDYQDDFDGIHGVIPPHELSADQSKQHEVAFNINDIQTEFHPHSEIPMQTRSFSTFQHNFQKQTISMPYDGVDQEFTFYYWDLWDWACDLLQDPYIGPQFTFDAQRLSKFDGQKFMRFIDEPWTVDTFWDAQSAMPADGKPLAFILYADKMKLSSFGCTKGYPVIARIANLPVSVRNGEGVGGGRVVGWLPIVKDDPAKSGKQKFANFKAAVWHESFKMMLKCLRLKRKHGGWIECWDKLQFRLFPIMPILSADYEEQCIQPSNILTDTPTCVMSLIRGVMGKFPCPICLVPRDELFDLLKIWPLHTRHGAVHLLRKARKKPTKAKLVNVFRALLFDCLHTNHEGLGGKHLWNELQKTINGVGREAACKIDKGFADAQRWRNLNHFKEVMGISFADGTKYEDILKLIVFIAHEVLDHESHELGYLLLQCIRAYLNVNMFAALEVHTMETLAAGRAALDEFSQVIKTYISKSESEPKNCNFLKIHLATHLFNDIMTKGVTRNFNSKPNEKAHRPLKKSYQLRTNFKDVAEQILRADHWSLVSTWVRYQLNDLDDYNVRNEELLSALEESDFTVEDVSPSHGIASLPGTSDSFHIKLGSRQRTFSIHAIQQAHIEDVAFDNFHTKLNHFFNTIPAITQRGDVALELTSNIVTEYRHLKVNFESMVDFRTSTDYIRCSPMFHNAPRYDSLMIKTQDGTMFARLIFIFTCIVGDTNHRIALVQACDVAVQNRPLKDRHLGFWWVRVQPRHKSEFIFVDSIVRGALLIEDGSRPGDFLLVDSIDTDMFLCTQKLHYNSG